MTALNPLWIQALTYSARLDRQLIKASFTEGVISGGRTTQRALGAQMNVDVATMVSVIYGDDQTDQGAYLDTVTVFENVTVTAAPGSNARWDLLYRRINDPNAGGPAGSLGAFGVLAGTASATPVVPTVPTSAIPIARIYVAAGTTSILDSMIYDMRQPAWSVGAPPPGVPMPWASNEASIPSNAVVCYGQAISRSTYWRIFYFLGTIHGGGDGSTTFNVPDLRGRSWFGLDNMGGSDAGRLAVANTLGASGGAETVTLDTTMIPSHAHTHASHNHTQNAHDHGGATGTMSADHSHSGTTGTGSANHNHGVTSGHNVMRQGFTLLDPYDGPSGAIGYDLDTFVDDGANHTHGFTTGGVSADHTHAIAAATATNNATTSTEAAVGGGLAHGNMPPYMLGNWILIN